jgi:DNA-binding CsgD family transcriptional regulator
MSRLPIRARDGTNQFRGSRRNVLTARQIQQVRQAWLAGETQQQIANAIGVSVDTLKARLQDQLASLPKRGRGTGGRRRPNDPTEEEIYGRLTLLEQQAWSDEERDQRWRGQVQGTGHPPLP